MRSLPVPETLLKRHCDAIAPIFAKKRMQILQVRVLQPQYRMVLLEVPAP